MSGVAFLVFIFIVFGLILAVIAFVAYRRVLRKAKGIERGLKMVPLLIHLPPPSDDTENPGTRAVQDLMREKVNQAQVLYDLIAGTAQKGFKSSFYGQRHIAFEIVASNGLVHYFAAVPVTMVSVVEQAIVTAYPGARLEEVEDHNIFNPQGKLTSTVGGELVLKHEAAYPIGTISEMERDPMEGLINALYKLQLGDGAAVQIMLRPANPGWTKRAVKLVNKKRHTKQGGMGFTLGDMARATVKTPEEWRQQSATFEVSKLEESVLQSIEEKTKHPSYEVLIRVLASSPNYDRSNIILRNIVTAFALFEAPNSNGFQYIEGRDIQGLVTAFIFRFFPPEVRSTILNSVELATLFHLPDSQFTATTKVERQQSKQVDGPVNMPANGLLMGYNFYRGVKKEIRLSPEDRRRHTYIVGQTGTGKSTILENLVVQDMLAGNGFAFIDPHGDTAEKLVSMVPKERAEDVVYFNPGDMEYPLGINLFEYDEPEQKDFLIQESINMLYKLYDPAHSGIIGPRFEHWYRNAALTLMADPKGASFIEIPKVFTDTEYLKQKFKYLQDPTVIEFWTKEMGQTSDYHKSEMLGWFVSKFGAFQSNEMMRNIIGQTHSAFNLREIMDKQKILIVNLGKGRVGELNSQLLGMIFVIKFQAAAMSRANMPEDQRKDFCLYVDEFQNFSTDSFASILSEARKYHLNLIVANQFIGQLSDEIRDAVFGNVGTIMSYRSGPEDAEFLVKQFQPIFDERDLVNLPNYNAVMKLLIGGLPSQPFSITALPPLGQAHPEMGLAIKQLSAAKYGVPRAQVEADIFARLQNKPRVEPQPAVPVQPPTVATQPTPASVSVAAPVANPAPNPLTSSPVTADKLLPAKPAPAATAATVAATAPVPVQPSAEPVATSPAAPAPTLAPTVPPVKPAPPTAPAPTDGLSIDQLKPAAQPTAPAAGEPVPVKTSINDVVKPAAAPLLIEAHEEDGRVDQAKPKQTPTADGQLTTPVSSIPQATGPTQSAVPVATPAPSPAAPTPTKNAPTFQEAVGPNPINQSFPSVQNVTPPNNSNPVPASPVTQSTPTSPPAPVLKSPANPPNTPPAPIATPVPPVKTDAQPLGPTAPAPLPVASSPIAAPVAPTPEEYAEEKAILAAASQHFAAPDINKSHGRLASALPAAATQAPGRYYDQWGQIHDQAEETSVPIYGEGGGVAFSETKAKIVPPGAVSDAYAAVAAPQPQAAQEEVIVGDAPPPPPPSTIVYPDGATSNPAPPPAAPAAPVSVISSPVIPNIPKESAPQTPPKPDSSVAVESKEKAVDEPLASSIPPVEVAPLDAPMPDFPEEPEPAPAPDPKPVAPPAPAAAPPAPAPAPVPAPKPAPVVKSEPQLQPEEKAPTPTPKVIAPPEPKVDPEPKPDLKAAIQNAATMTVDELASAASPIPAPGSIIQPTPPPAPSVPQDVPTPPTPPAPPAPPAQAGTPKLAPGEVYVDEHGNVVQG